jgi:anthranilate synthase/aminodeoxychorismate synthase-like glutamine amidotransferase
LILLIDNYDSFTYNLADYFMQLGEQITVVKNDELSIEELKNINFSHLVLSPGPKKPKETNNLMEIIKTFHEYKPILGVCLGHQALGEFFGASLHKAINPMHGKTSTIQHHKKNIFKHLPDNINVCRYHSLVIDINNCPELELSAYTNDNECMGFDHKLYPISGIQFHPEAILTQYGKEMLINWLEITNTK